MKNLPFYKIFPAPFCVQYGVSLGRTKDYLWTNYFLKFNLTAELLAILGALRKILYDKVKESTTIIDTPAL